VRIAEYVNDGWSFDCSYVWAVPVNLGDLLDSEIEIRISEWDLIYIASATDDGDDEHAYDAQKVAYNRAWDDLDLEATFEHRRENGMIRRKPGGRHWEYEDAEFADPEHIKFDTDDLVDAAVEVYLNPREATPTIRDPRQFELNLEALRRRAGIGNGRSGERSARQAGRRRLHRPLQRPDEVERLDAEAGPIRGMRFADLEFIRHALGQGIFVIFRLSFICEHDFVGDNPISFLCA
jgi:hypothetical protein